MKFNVYLIRDRLKIYEFISRLYNENRIKRINYIISQRRKGRKKYMNFLRGLLMD